MPCEAPRSRIYSRSHLGQSFRAFQSKGGKTMRIAGFLFAVTGLLLLSDGSSQAASYGCSQDKCHAACSKSGGRVNRCAQWCSEQIRKDPKCNKS
jgi:hypothetical protein